MTSSPDIQRRPRVLVVDDQPANLRLLAEVLRDVCDVLVATSGGRALEIAAQGGVDLILLDVVMPGMDGIEACIRLKADPGTRGVPVIFVSGRGEVNDETRGFDVGGVDYITKPISAPLVCARVKTHLELKAARDALERMASIDGLTGVANRRHLDAALDNEWRRAARGGKPLTLAMMDVDHFKAFNDTYGHARGDECLRAVAAALSARCGRAADLVARYGGEEFALVLPETDAPGARDLLLGLLRGVEDLGLPHRGSGCADHVTLSAGAVTLVPTTGTSAMEALGIADGLLYEAKRAGRRRAVLSDLDAGSSQTVVPPGSPAR